MKRRIFCKSVQIVMVLVMLLAFAAPAFAAEPLQEAQTVLRVGLYYKDNAMATANLENYSGAGSGYRFGYYGADMQFVPLGYTAQTQISMLKTHNIYLTASNTYSTTATDRAVGCYHVQLPGSYQDFDSVKAAADAAGGFVAWINGVYCVRVGSYVSRTLASDAAAGYEGASVGETTKYGISVTVTGTTTILFQFDDEGTGTGLGVEPDLTGAADRQTWFKGFRYRGGFRYQRIDGGDLTVVNVVGLEDYVKGVVPYEMSPSWPLEALKAQAVCARTYALSHLNKHKTYGFDVCNGDECQVYSGVNKENTTTLASVTETAGMTMKYNGKYIDAVFSSSDGGATEAAKNVWGTDFPYLQGVVDPYEAAVADQIPNYAWTKSMTGTELQAKLVANGRTGCGVITKVTINYTEMGNVYSMTFLDNNGKSWTVYREPCRTYFGFRSQRFTLAGADTPGTGVPGNGGSVVINGTAADASSGLYAIDGSGNLVQLGSEYAILTGSGTVTVSNAAGGNGSTGGTTGGGTSESSGVNGVFTFQGTGFGHNVGMSQWGACAMAQQGLSYLDILTFYYTGVTVGS